MTVIQLICRYIGVGPDFLDRARPVLALLAAQPSCEKVQLARSTEDAHRWMLTAEFADFAGYRRALSPFDVRVIVIPFLSEADQQTSAVLEVLLAGHRDAITEYESVVDPAQIWSGDTAAPG